MCQNQHSISLGFTDETVPMGTHLCYFYSDEDERTAVISKFLESGLTSSEKTLYFTKDLSLLTLIDHMKKGEVDLAEEQSKGHFEIKTTQEFYYPDGVFNPDKQFGRLHQYYADICDEGYQSIRLAAEMHWALEDIQGADRLLEYETRWNEELKHSPITAICQYNTNLFDGNMIMNILRVHPLVITNGQIVHNPFYVL